MNNSNNEILFSPDSPLNNEIIIKLNLITLDS